MKKHLITAVLAVACACVMSVPAFAGIWIQDTNTGAWHYDVLGRGVSDGFLKNQWAWIDSNHDGTSQCFYFDADGNMAANTIVEGYTVDEFGHWTVDGVVQDRITPQQCPETSPCRPRRQATTIPPLRPRRLTAASSGRTVSS